MQACAMLTGRAPLAGPSRPGARSSAAHAGGSGAPSSASSSPPHLLSPARRTAGGVRRRWPSSLAHRRAASGSSSSSGSSSHHHHPRASSSSSSVVEPMLAPAAAAAAEASAATTEEEAGPGPSSTAATALPHSFFSDDEGEPRPAFLDRAAPTSPHAAAASARPRRRPNALAPSTAAQTLSRSLLPHEDAAAGALVGALAGSALGVAYEPEHHTRLPRMFPDGITDFWTVDLPERPRGRAALENPVVAAVPGRAALEYAAMVACARSLARCGGKVESADLLDALVDCRRGIAGSAGAAAPSSSASSAADASYVVLPPAPRRFSSPYTDLATEAVSTAAATGAADPATLSTLAEAAMARGLARTAPTASDRPHRREFGAHDFGAATFLGAPLGLAYQDAELEELGQAVDEACAATHPAQSGRDGAAIVAAAVGWLSRERRRRLGGGGGADDDAASNNGPRELASYLLASAAPLRLGDEARDVLAMVAGALGVVAEAEGGDAADAKNAPATLAPRHPLGSGGPPLDNIVPPGLDGAPGRWRVFWASTTWSALSASAARVAGGSFATNGARLAGLAVLLLGAAGFEGTGDNNRGSGANGPAQAVSLAVTMGGACSATASVVGAMAGALHGVGWVPARWWARLEDQLPGDSARATGRAWDGVGRRAAVALGGALGGVVVAAADGEERQ